jgi:hypothetical protein
VACYRVIGVYPDAFARRGGVPTPACGEDGRHFLLVDMLVLVDSRVRFRKRGGPGELAEVPGTVALAGVVVRVCGDNAGGVAEGGRAGGMEKVATKASWPRASVPRRTFSRAGRMIPIPFHPGRKGNHQRRSASFRQ